MKTTRAVTLIGAALAVTILLSGCLEGPPPVLASPEITQAAVNLEKPPVDRARVFVFTGRAPMRAYMTGPMVEHSLPADIYVNNIKIGTVKPKEVMVFDVAPRRYTFTWMIYNQKAGLGEEMKPGVFDLQGGTITFLSAELAAFVFSVNQGAMTVLLDKDQKRLAPDVKVVRAVHCPPTICI
jgi:hypothetical protein